MEFPRVRRFVFSLLLLLVLCTGIFAQATGRIASIKLLTPEVGWVATGQRLFWTTDGGTQWKNITPTLSHKWQAVSSVFFLDSSTGWVLLHCADRFNPQRDDTCFEVAFTTDAGQNWSTVHPKIVDPVLQTDFDDWSGFSGVTYLNFVDSKHGWAILKQSTKVDSSSGEMLRTVDGGHTWTQLTQGTLPVAGHLRFVTAKDGWLAGGPDASLYATHDAGDSWQQIELSAPKNISPDFAAVYDLPTFLNKKLGLLPVLYEDTMSSRAPLVLFQTEDGGSTWQSTLTPSQLPNAHPWAPLPSAVVDRELVTATVGAEGKQVNLLRSPSNSGTAIQSAEIPTRVLSVGELSFVSPTRGWLLADSRLLSTSDGGASWTDATPGGAVPLAAPAQHAGRIPAPSKALASHSDLAPAPDAVSSTTSISTHLGFDTFPTPTTSAMQAWWSASPYYDVAIYLYGSPNKTTNKKYYASPQWLTTVQSYGWGIIPVWFGLQSPCVITRKGISQFFGPTAADASTQGAEQADLAVAADQKLGITGGIIYTDIENYTVNATCSPLVQAYVDGFVSEIHTHTGYNVGVYANPRPITNDISNESVEMPDAIWVTKTPSASGTPQVTIWNQGILDTLWPNNQRTHQFLIDQPNVTFGGISMSIDDDIEDSPIIGSDGIKPANPVYNTIDGCAALSTNPFAINDMNAGAFINSSGQTGMIVGYYLGTDFLIHAFEDTAGVCTVIDYGGAVQTLPRAINNAGTVVGGWKDSGGVYHGFILSGGVATSYDYPGGDGTFLYGVNDAGQILGVTSISGVSQGFIYYPPKNKGNPYTIPAPGNAINGEAFVVGNVQDTSIFSYEEFLQPPTWSGASVNLPQGSDYFLIAYGVDNSDDIVGIYEASTGPCAGANNCGFVIPSGSTVPTVLQDPVSTTTQTFGMNDFGQVVGDYLDLSSGYEQGMLITLQQ